MGDTSLADALDASVNTQYVTPHSPRTMQTPDNSNSTTSPFDNSPKTMTDNPFRSIEAQPHDMKDSDPNARDSNDHWNFGTSGLTPSMMDPNSQSFNIFANQMPGYYTPTPGGTSTLYHHQAGDLHTPGYTMGLGTPLSLPTSEGALHAGHQAAAFQGFHAHIPQHIQQQPFHNVNPYQMHQQTGFPPHQFSHEPSFEHLDPHVGESPVDDMGMEVSMSQQHHSPHMLFHSSALQSTMQPPPMHPNGEKSV